MSVSASLVVLRQRRYVRVSVLLKNVLGSVHMSIHTPAQPEKLVRGPLTPLAGRPNAAN
jgi:hypothetical protein